MLLHSNMLKKACDGGKDMGCNRLNDLYEKECQINSNDNKKNPVQNINNFQNTNINKK